MHSPYKFSPISFRFAYNDATWLVDKLKSFAKEWHLRKDITPRALNLVNIDSEIGPLESFGKRAYKNEMDTQRTILHDLLGGMHACSSFCAIVNIIQVLKISYIMTAKTQSVLLSVISINNLPLGKRYFLLQLGYRPLVH